MPDETSSRARKRAAWTYQRPQAPGLSSLRHGREARRAFWQYWVRDNIQNAVELAFHFSMKLLPSDTCSAVGARVGAFVLPRWHKGALAKARVNLERLRPDLDAAGREALLARAAENQGRLMMEFSIVSRLGRTPERVIRHNLHHVTDAQARGPVILTALHIGNWELLAPLVVNSGIPFSTTYMPPRQRARAWIADRVRRSSGVALLPPGKDAIRPSLSLLKAGGTVCYFCDEAFGGWIRGPLFGRPPHLEGNLATVVRLARISGARICPVYVVRETGAWFSVHALPAIELAPGRGDVVEDVLQLNAAIEPVVRAHLDQWYFLFDSL